MIDNVAGGGRPGEEGKRGRGSHKYRHFTNILLVKRERGICLVECPWKGWGDGGQKNGSVVKI